MAADMAYRERRRETMRMWAQLKFWWNTKGPRPRAAPEVLNSAPKWALFLLRSLKTVNVPVTSGC